jgi:hypothetical protein
MEPVAAHCQTAGGQLSAVEHDASGARRLPVLLACDGRQAAMWYFRLSYAQSPGSGRGVYVRILDARVLDENQLQEARRVAEDRRRRDEESRARAQTQREAAIKAAVEREAQEREARQQQLAAFQANLKQGDRIRWLLRAPGDYAVGMVVRIEGELVFVQFNNAVVSGSSTRYVRRSELEPWNGVPTGVTYNTP